MPSFVMARLCTEIYIKIICMYLGFLSVLLQPKRTVKRKMFICEISIIILISQKLGLVGPVQQKFKLPSPKHHLSRL